VCVHNLDVSGANEVIVNILKACAYPNVVVISPKIGPQSDRFLQAGAAVRIGDAKKLILDGYFSDVYSVVCNSLLTADVVCAAERLPCIWIIHEYASVILSPLLLCHCASTMLTHSFAPSPPIHPYTRTQVLGSE